jgi:hypothetical protein
VSFIIILRIQAQMRGFTGIRRVHSDLSISGGACMRIRCYKKIAPAISKIFTLQSIKPAYIFWQTKQYEYAVHVTQ